MENIQSSTKYPIADSSSEGDLFKAAEARMGFWNYPPGEKATVTVALPGTGKTIEVTRTPEGVFSVLRKK